jgi:polyphosphate glucokinase
MSVLGIDFGGSGIKGAIVDLNNGRLVTERKRLLTPRKGKPNHVTEVVKEIVDHFAWEGLIGFGYPGVVRDGIAISAANISMRWVGVDINDILTKATNCAVFSINDADAAGIAEMTFGAGRDMKKGVVMMLTLGTGIGSAIFVDGNLLPNTEFGHFLIRGKDAEKRASDAIRKKKELSWEQWSKRLQEYLDWIEFLIPPDLFILGGGVSKNAESFLPFLKTKAKIVPAQFLNEAGIVGAALFANSRK